MFNIEMILGGIVGAAASAGVVILYTSIVTVPNAREEEKAIVVAQGIKKAEEAIGEIGNVAERSRAARRLCILNGVQYDFGTGKCRQSTASPGG